MENKIDIPYVNESEIVYANADEIKTYISYDLVCSECSKVKKRNELTMLGFCYYCTETCWKKIKMSYSIA